MDIKLDIDLAQVSSDYTAFLAHVIDLYPATKLNTPAARVLQVNMPGVHRGFTLPINTRSVADIIVHGIKSIDEEMAKSPDNFRPNLYPFGRKDWKLTRFYQDKDGNLYLEGKWKPEAWNRTPRTIHPESAIELRRQSPREKGLSSSAVFPDLKDVTLHVWQWPNGKHVVMGAYENEADCPPARKATNPESPHELRLRYPSSSLPPLEWNPHIATLRTPATHALQMWDLGWANKPKDWLLSSWTEAVFISLSNYGPVTDMRASLVSGPTGPAPLPEKNTWPCCPHCRKPTLFSQSLDFRDLAFINLLPGSTAVIFICNDCLEQGELSNCAAVVWLDHNSSVVLKDNGPRAPLRQCVQYYGPDSKNRSAIEAGLYNELEKLAPKAPTPFLWMPSSNGTKAGGVPAYLQNEVNFYDSNGVVMEYIGQIATPDHIAFSGFGYISHSTATGETYIDFQDT